MKILEVIPKEYKLLLYYSIIVSIINIGLSLFGEWRVDIYAALQILAFIMLRSTMSPFHPKVEEYLGKISTILLIVLIIIIAFRIITVVGVFGI